MDDGSKPKPGTIARAFGESLDLGVLDLTNVDFKDLAPGAVVAAEDVTALVRPSHGLSPAEVENVRLRRFAQGPFERRAWRWEAERIRLEMQRSRKAAR